MGREESMDFEVFYVMWVTPKSFKSLDHFSIETHGDLRLKVGKPPYGDKQR